MTYEALEPTVLTLRDYAIAWASANGWELPFAIKRRDPKEPGRRIKEKSEDRLYAIMRRHWAYQKRVIREQLTFRYPGKKTLPTPPISDFDMAFQDEQFHAQILNWLLDAENKGLLIFDAENLLNIDMTIVNQEAARWAREYSGLLVKQIDKTTRGIIRDQIGTFVDTPGYTVGDVVRNLPFTENRALMIAATETTKAYGKADELAGVQLQKEYPDVQVVKRWFTNQDDLVCPICAPNDLNIIGAIPVDQPFPSGHNSPPAHPRCLPGDTLVLPIGGVSAGSKRRYKGDVVTIETHENKLTVTPNHPILTPSGWVHAGCLNEGDYAIGYKAGEWEAAMIQGDNENSVTTIKNKFSTLGFDRFRVPTSAPDFHGDGAGSDVAIIRTNSQVVNNVNAQGAEPIAEQDFILRDVISQAAFSAFSTLAEFVEADLPTTSGIMSSGDLVSTLGATHSRPLDSFGFGLAAGSDTSSDHPIAESPPIDTSLFSESILRLAGKVTLQKIIKIRNFDYSGHVYNLQTDSGLYVAAGIITHNCRCWRTSSTQIIEEIPDTYSSIREHEQGIVNQKYETAKFFDKDGNLLYEKDGGAHHVSFDESEIRAAKNKILTHNHPSGQTFSVDDVYFMNQAQLEEIRATGKYGTYSMKNNYKVTRSMLEKALKEAAESRVAYDIPSYSKKEMLNWEKLWKLISKDLGYEYSFVEA